jgi:hypothetical protein
MASIPTQEEVLAATRKGQEAMMAAIKTWLETVRTAAPKLPSTLQVSLPFADKLPTPQDAVANAYHLAEQLLASQRKFAEDLVKATAPLRAGYRQSSPEVPSRSAWQDAVTDSTPKTPAVSAAPKAVTSTEPQAADNTAPKAVTSTEPQAADNTAPKAVPTRPAVKSTPTRTAPRTAAAQRSTAGAASTTATSARKSATGSTARKSTTASSAGSARKSAGTTSPAPKDTDKS